MPCDVGSPIIQKTDKQIPHTEQVSKTGLRDLAIVNATELKHNVYSCDVADCQSNSSTADLTTDVLTAKLLLVWCIRYYKMIEIVVFGAT